MPTTIKLKNGSGAPLAGDLVQGEPALDLTNKRLYTEDSGGSVIEVGTNPSALAIAGTDVTATATELNVLDGITATTAELNILDGVTATASELNVLDGITATTTELNYTDGVTSAIQTQLNAKAPIDGATFTGTTTIPTADINGGAIDGVTIGGASAGAITGTTVTATGLVTAQDGLVVDNDGATVATFDRATSDGTIAVFQKNGTTIGAIGVANGDNFYIASDDTTDVGLKFDGDANAIYACDAVGGIRDNAVTLGDPAVRFKDLYLSGGAYIGGTGSANKLDDYEEGTWTPTYTSGGTNPTLVYSVQNGRYTKIGGHITIQCAITVATVTSAGTGSLYISGLPFTNGGTQGGVSVNWANGSWTSQMPEFGHIPTTENRIFLVYTASTNTISIGTGSLKNGCEFIFTGEYSVW